MPRAIKATPSPNFDARPEGVAIDMLVVHYTGMASAAAALQRMTDARAKVSAHYMIDEDGAVTHLVAEDMRAWHAGVAAWRGESDINGRAIGVELVNPGHEFGYSAFPAAQMAAFAELAGVILARHPIPAANVVGHSDVAPRRRRDPGEKFDWRGMAAQGIGLWPGDAEPLESTESLAMLERYGYETSDREATVRAFQRHFRAAAIDGVMDAGCTGLLVRLLALAGAGW